jgi:hypothetical protein
MDPPNPDVLPDLSVGGSALPGFPVNRYLANAAPT